MKNISPGVLRDGGAESIPLDLTQVMLAEEGRAEKIKSTENLDKNLKAAEERLLDFLLRKIKSMGGALR